MTDQLPEVAKTREEAGDTPEVEVLQPEVERSDTQRRKDAETTAKLVASILFSGEKGKQAEFVEDATDIAEYVDAGEVLDNLDSLPLTVRLLICCGGFYLMAAKVDPNRYGLGRVVQRLRDLRAGRGESGRERREQEQPDPGSHSRSGDQPDRTPASDAGAPDRGRPHHHPDRVSEARERANPV